MVDCFHLTSPDSQLGDQPQALQPLLKFGSSWQEIYIDYIAIIDHGIRGG